MIEAQPGGEAIRRDRTGNDAGAEPALARGRDDPAAGAMDAARPPTAERDVGEWAAADLRSAECQPVGEGRLQADPPTAHPCAPLGLGTDEAGHRRARIERCEPGARLVDEGPGAEVRPGVTAPAPCGPEVGLHAEVHGTPRAGGVGRGDDVRPERTCGHERAELPG